LGKSAPEMLQLQGTTQFTEIIQNALSKQYRFKIKAKEEVYQDQPRLKATVIRADLIDVLTESTNIIQQIQLLENM